MQFVLFGPFTHAKMELIDARGCVSLTAAEAMQDLMPLDRILFADAG